MDRRAFLRACTSGGILITAGCAELLGGTSDQQESADVFEHYRYEGSELVVRFQDGVDVDQAVLYDRSTETEYETVTYPPGSARFSVVFSDRLESYVSKSLRVKAETTQGWVNKGVWGPVHGAVKNVEVLPNGRARFEIENTGEAPLLVRFVGIYGDVPNPTVNPQSDSFDRSTFGLGPSVIGIGRNSALSPSRTDLVVPAGETAPFKTMYAPFAFPDGATMTDCDGDKHTGTIAVVHTSGGSAAYTFSYHLGAEPTPIENTSAKICGDVE